MIKYVMITAVSVAMALWVSTLASKYIEILYGTIIKALQVLN